MSSNNTTMSRSPKLLNYQSKKSLNIDLNNFEISNCPTSLCLPPLSVSPKKKSYRSASFCKNARFKVICQSNILVRERNPKVEDIMRKGAISLGVPIENNKVQRIKQRISKMQKVINAAGSAKKKLLHKKTLYNKFE
jgi:hypothetical protein